MKPKPKHYIDKKAGGAYLRALRLSHGLTQAQLGKCIRLDHSSISNMERGRRSFGPLKQLSRICNYFDITPAELITATYNK